MNRPRLSLMLLLCWIVVPLVTVSAQDTAARRQQAQTLAGQGDWNDALKIYESLIADSKVTGTDAANDLKASYKCMESLAQYERLDPIVATAIETHPRDWRVLSQAAHLIGQAPHIGVLTGQTFVRDQGEPFVQIDVTTYEEDRGLIRGTKLQAHGELRDNHIAFLIEYLPQGRHVLRYQMRCEFPGQYTALPAVVSAMHVATLVGNSRDNDLLISE